jgi:hypothetical protein
MAEDSMGTWGTAIYSDDTASDVRGDYRDLVGDGLSGPEATEALLRHWKDALDDQDDGPVFWLALALTQWQCGRLEPRVQEKALAVIADGSDLQRWKDDPKLWKKRQAVLARVDQQLRAPQPGPKKIPRRYRDTCDWEIGAVVSYRLQSGRLALFRVIGFHADKGGTSPVCELLDWQGLEMPAATAVGELAVKPSRFGNRQFLLGRLKEKELPFDRVQCLGIRATPTQTPGGYMVFLWRNLDHELKKAYGLE